MQHIRLFTSFLNLAVKLMLNNGYPPLLRLEIWCCAKIIVARLLRLWEAPVMWRKEVRSWEWTLVLMIEKVTEAKILCLWFPFWPSLNSVAVHSYRFHFLKQSTLIPGSIYADCLNIFTRSNHNFRLKLSRRRYSTWYVRRVLKSQSVNDTQINTLIHWVTQ